MSKKFAELGVKEAVLTVLKKTGIIEATPVQEAAIPVVRSGRDVIVQAPTGTGKTIAFLLPLMERMKSDIDVIQTLIVTPTRELTIQIAKVARQLGEAYGIRALPLYGGQDIQRQKAKLGQHPQVIIGTPGRLLDHWRHGRLNLSTANKVVLDEADEMLKRGFIEDVEKLLKELAGDHQLLLFSATIPDGLRVITRRFMDKPAEITIEAEHVTLDNIHQIVYRSTEETKLDKLCAYINESHPYLMMVFCSTRERVIKLTMELAGRGYLVDEFHGELTQVQRALVLKRFRDAKLQIIVTTDIAARGLDIEGVTHVVNYDIPRTVTDYIHRIGRTGRAGREGEAITFVNDKQQEQLRRIEAGIKAHIRRESMKKRPEKTKKETPAEKKETTDSRRDKWAKPDKKRKPLTRAKAKAAAHSGRDSRNKKNRPAAPKAAKIGAPIKKRNKR